MKLTKIQIDYIEHRLIEEGVKYWDIRIELLDHVISDVENTLENQEGFKKAVQKSFISLGWNGIFKELVCERLKEINKKIRKQYFKKVIVLYQKVISI